MFVAEICNNYLFLIEDTKNKTSFEPLVVFLSIRFLC